MSDNAIDYAAIRARLDAATPGPWTHEPYGGQNQNGDYSGGCVYDADGEWVVSEVGDAEGALIAHARTDLEQLLDRVEELEAARERSEDAVWTAAIKVLSDFDTVLNVKGEAAYIVSEFKRALAAAPAAGEETT